MASAGRVLGGACITTAVTTAESAAVLVRTHPGRRDRLASSAVSRMEAVYPMSGGATGARHQFRSTGSGSRCIQCGATETEDQQCATDLLARLQRSIDRDNCFRPAAVVGGEQHG